MGKRRGGRKEQDTTGPKRGEQGRRGKGWVVKSMGVGREQQVFARSQRHSALSRGFCVGKGSAVEHGRYQL